VTADGSRHVDEALLQELEAQRQLFLVDEADPPRLAKVG
jgi:hypothetical protein